MNSNWFKRIKEGITTSTREKKETPEGLWYKCPSCKNIIPSEEHFANMMVCPKCEYHEKIGSEDYFHILFDDKFTEIAKDLTADRSVAFRRYQTLYRPLNSISGKNTVERCYACCGR